MTEATPGQTSSTPVEPVTPAEPAKPVEPVAAEPAKPVEKLAEPAKPVVPDTYAFTAPEGSDMDVNALQGLSPAFKAAGLTQENAQNLVNAYVAHMDAQRTAQMQAWGDQARADKDLGGANFDANVQTAQKAIGRFATPEFKAYLDQTGLGNHPEMLRTFHRIGKAISEDTPPAVNTPPASRTAKDVYTHPSSQATLR